MNTIPTTNGSSAATPSRRAVKTATGEGAAYWFFGGLAVIRSPDGALPVIIEMNVPPGEGVPLHHHTRLDDSYYVLSSRIAVRCGDEVFVAGPGDYVSEPAGVPQTLYVLDNGPAVLLQAHAKEDLLNFIRQAGTPVTERSRLPDQPLTFAELFRIAGATGQPVIGPRCGKPRPNGSRPQRSGEPAGSSSTGPRGFPQPLRIEQNCPSSSCSILHRSLPPFSSFRACICPLARSSPPGLAQAIPMAASATSHSARSWMERAHRFRTSFRRLELRGCLTRLAVR